MQIVELDGFPKNAMHILRRMQQECTVNGQNVNPDFRHKMSKLETERAAGRRASCEDGLRRGFDYAPLEWENAESMHSGLKCANCILTDHAGSAGGTGCRDAMRNAAARTGMGLGCQERKGQSGVPETGIAE